MCLRDSDPFGSDLELVSRLALVVEGDAEGSAGLADADEWIHEVAGDRHAGGRQAATERGEELGWGGCGNADATARSAP